MRVLVIDPFTRKVEERNILPDPKEIQRIIGGFALLTTFTHDRSLNFVSVNELPRSESHFQLGTDHVFSGLGVIFGSNSPFHVEMKSTDLSVAKIAEVATFFDAPRPPMGWLR